MGCVSRAAASAACLFSGLPDNALAPIPRLSKEWIQNVLPPSPARDHSLALKLDVLNDSDGDADGMTAISLLAPHYAHAVRRVSFSGWLGTWVQTVHLSVCQH